MASESGLSGFQFPDIGIKPYYQDKFRVIYKGDCRDITPLFPDNSFGIVLTDIPYGAVNRSSNGLRNLDKSYADVWDMKCSDLVALLAPKFIGSIYIFCGTEQVSDLRRAMISFKLSTRIIVWEKSNPSPMNGQCIWLSGVELCVFGKKPKGFFKGSCLNTVLRYPCVHNQRHPTEKSEQLFSKLVSVSSQPDTIVFDPFCGSATSLIASTNNGNYSIGVELSEESCEIAAERCSKDAIERIQKGVY